MSVHRIRRAKQSKQQLQTAAPTMQRPDRDQIRTSSRSCHRHKGANHRSEHHNDRNCRNYTGTKRQVATTKNYRERQIRIQTSGRTFATTKRNHNNRHHDTAIAAPMTASKRPVRSRVRNRRH